MTKQELLPLLEHELKVREYYSKRQFELSSLSLDFAKLVITNLIWINSAGLGALPVILKITGVDRIGLRELTDKAFWPGTLFAIGLLTALLSALVVYLNLYSSARFYEGVGNSYLTNFYSHVSAIVDKEDMILFHKGEDAYVSMETTHASRLAKIAFMVAHACGWVSLGCFLLACNLILKLQL